jgi:ParB family transcriptional regulator, chromosome partitioning protein
VAPAEPKSQGGLIDELNAAAEAMKRVPWAALEQLKGNADILRRIDETEALLRSLRKTLS